jgi:hypothetical protein
MGRWSYELKNTQDTKHQHKKHIEYDGMKKDVKEN